MKKIKIIRFMLLSFIVFVLSCERRDYLNNSRFHVEGLTNAPRTEVKVVIGSVVYSKGKTNELGYFRLGGPESDNSEKFLIFERKIKSFSVNDARIKLSSDSSAIVLPYKVSYIKFNHILLQ